ncbi:Hydrogenase maturation protein, carbamoyltransferase HypF [Caloramator quimbayensis]|uniref:Carbamoyltransferase n=1 Tax=Caloramator quimbayensis TaxID=1147123 RepID=A0A1T4X0W7_9CLOT|nr:carbamoyltransferase HypF [Caloramator quimbayensis]SKA83230.1 Hydrogenase maturation protein, carbamoyltransferase HypF [Caloramator quimbayensis]
MKTIRLDINGIVQGVGFRPFIHKLVNDYNIKGWIKNTSSGVLMEIQGQDKSLINFIQDLIFKNPKLSVIEKIKVEEIENTTIYRDFKIIKSSENKEKFTLISPDVCICDDCLRELFDKRNRRYRYPFINCTNCGPRFTIIKDIPYDRDKTTMKNFKMCEKCEGEYREINDRRYHAQPNCCFDCGPEIYFIDKEGNKIEKDPIKETANYIREGKIVAIKGIGGFHLCCDALNGETVNELRKRKHRDEKPFALMAKNIESIKKWCFINEAEEKMLTSYKRPIVLLRKKYDKTFEYISMDNRYLGFMLPYTPVHYLIFEEDLDVLVMTSANLSDFPIEYKNEEALERLSSIADGFLMNDRDIYVRCDDSVVREFNGKEYPLRRSRGYVPFPIKINEDIGKILACGAEQKSSFALSRNNYIFLSQHIGDMKNIETFDFYMHQINHFQNLFNVKPVKIACDFHPDYMSTQYAIKKSKEDGVLLCFVQHHHAHMASCMADNNLKKDVIGVIWDGTGYGIDGTIWGGEFLAGNYSGFKRLGSIKPIPLPGGDRAVKDIYRIGYSVLYETYNKIPEDFRFYEDYLAIEKMLNKKINTPYASSIGRLFDAIASITNVKQKASYEGQGAVVLENISQKTEEYYEFEIKDINDILKFDWTYVIEQVVYDVRKNISPSIISAKFMNTLIYVSSMIVERIGKMTGIKDVVLSGGVFQNMYLLPQVKRNIELKGFNVYCHSRVSANDEGIALGQCLIAYHGGDIKCV